MTGSLLTFASESAKEQVSGGGPGTNLPRHNHDTTEAEKVKKGRKAHK